MRFIRHARELTSVEQKELVDLNNAVTDAIRARKEWLNRKMHEISHLHPGDDIYDLDSGKRLGTVSRLYRYHTDRNVELDCCLSFHCEYSVDTNCYDNTSRQIGLRWGTKEQAREAAETRSRLLK